MQPHAVNTSQCFRRTTILAAVAFLDAFQKVADMATNSRGEFAFSFLTNSNLQVVEIRKKKNSDSLFHFKRTFHHHLGLFRKKDHPLTELKTHLCLGSYLFFVLFNNNMRIKRTEILLHSTPKMNT